MSRLSIILEAIFLYYHHCLICLFVYLLIFIVIKLFFHFEGATVHARDFCGWQPLHEACNFGHTGFYFTDFCDLYI